MLQAGKSDSHTRSCTGRRGGAGEKTGGAGKMEDNAGWDEDTGWWVVLLKPWLGEVVMSGGTGLLDLWCALSGQCCTPRIPFSAAGFRQG